MLCTSRLLDPTAQPQGHPLERLVQVAEARRRVAQGAGHRRARQGQCLSSDSRLAGAANVGGQPRAAPTRFVFFARGNARLVGCNALFGSPPLPRTALVVLRTPRRASLTASADGKAAATSGSSRTRLLPLRSRATYLPRTPPFIDAKSYSGLRSSSAGLGALLIEFSFAPRRSSGADDPDGIVSFGMRHDQETSPLGDTNGHKAHLTLGMSRTVAASLKLTRRRLTFAAAFSGSHSNSTL